MLLYRKCNCFHEIKAWLLSCAADTKTDHVQLCTRTAIPSKVHIGTKQIYMTLLCTMKCYSVDAATTLVVVAAAMLKQLAANSTLRRTCATE